MQNLSTLTLVSLGLALAGCTQIAPPRSFSNTHPANPDAAEANYPVAGPGLMAGTNYEMIPLPEAKPIEMPENGSESMKMPTAKGAEKASEKPAEHEHNLPKQ